MNRDDIALRFAVAIAGREFMEPNELVSDAYKLADEFIQRSGIGLPEIDEDFDVAQITIKRRKR